VEVGGGSVDLVIRTAVGDLIYATCSQDHTLRIDSSGATYWDDFDPDARCAPDWHPCMRHRQRPWKGQIEVDQRGRFSQVVDFCWDTCMGQFRGKARLELRESSGGWRQRADEDMLGLSGLEIDGGWRFDRRAAIEIQRSE
jgi:hypothetical protein